MIRIQSDFEDNSNKFDNNLDLCFREIKEIDNRFSNRFEREYYVKIII